MQGDLGFVPLFRPPQEEVALPLFQEENRGDIPDEDDCCTTLARPLTRRKTTSLG